MSRITEFHIFALTRDDIDRIKGLLRSVEVAIGEYVTFRCVRPFDAAANFSLEDEVYEHTSEIFADCALKSDDHF